MIREQEKLISRCYITFTGPYYSDIFNAMTTNSGTSYYEIKFQWSLSFISTFCFQIIAKRFKDEYFIF